MNRFPAESAATFGACVLAAAGASWLPGISWNSSALAAGSVFLVVTALQAARTTPDRADSVPLFLMAGGVCVAALGAMLAALLGGTSLLAGALALVGAGVSGAGLTAAARRWRESGEQMEELRSRLVRREGDVRAQAERIRRLDRSDLTTGLMNRRGLAIAAEQALAECEAASQPLALLLVDLGAPLLPGASEASDRERAARVARYARQAVRASDAVGLWDPGLLAVLLPRCREPEPARQRLYESLSAEARTWGPKPPVVAGLSIPPEGPWPDAEGLMSAAQAALSAAHHAPVGSTRPIWPMAWGLASTLVTHPSTDTGDRAARSAERQDQGQDRRQDEWQEREPAGASVGEPPSSSAD